MKLFKTKTFWVGVATIVGAVADYATNGDLARSFTTAMIGVGMITGRNALNKV